MYEGYYTNDKKHGFGKFIWKDGGKYVGMWEHGKQHGEGITIRNGMTIKGIWQQGELIKIENSNSNNILNADNDNNYDSRANANAVNMN
mmetsp:Transcript_10412/g.22933  ORF Transcript_10412/g.22933 Transcript_10412/m.22933 type:complete len:89 (+) Transcript_10412:909-1175(+)